MPAVPPQPYVARFGPTRRDLLLVPICVLFVVVGAFMATQGETVMGSLAALIGGAYLVLLTVALVSRRPALAVTAAGVTLGMVPPWPASRTAFVPWADIEAVVLWRQAAGQTSVRYIGLHRRADAPPLPGSMRSSMLKRMSTALVPPNVPPQLMADSRPVSFWRLDKPRLIAAVNDFAPQVLVIDET
jgi:hypothetical protein